MESNSQPRGALHPVQFSVAYPDRDLNRLTTGFRLIVAIPILIVAATVGHEWAGYGPGPEIAAGSGGVLFLAPLLLIVFRQKYPRWWYDWNLELLRERTKGRRQSLTRDHCGCGSSQADPIEALAVARAASREGLAEDD